mgnify:CR=1 FL=1
MPVLPPAMVVTDLDGTLLDARRVCPEANREALEGLGRLGVCRVVATGRSLHAANHVLTPGFPIDYLVFSAGAGVVRMADRALLHRASLNAEGVRRAADALAALALDYVILDPVPDSHWFTGFPTPTPHPDYRRRRELYAGFEHPGGCLPESACQFIAITAPREGLVEDLRGRLPAHTVVRTTSPLDHSSLWIELFPASVSKAAAARFVAAGLPQAPTRVLAVGNDFNDLDLLEWATDPVVVGNAPAELRARFRTVADHGGAGFAEAVEGFLASVAAKAGGQAGS